MSINVVQLLCCLVVAACCLFPLVYAIGMAWAEWKRDKEEGYDYPDSCPWWQNLIGGALIAVCSIIPAWIFLVMAWYSIH